MGIIRLAVKSSLAGGMVYYTVQEGLWSNADDTIQLYRRIYTNVSPYVKQNIPKDIVNEIPELPSVSTMSNCAKAMWNKGVKSSIKFVSELPSHVSNGVDSLMTMSGAKEAIGGTKDKGEPSKQQ